MSLTGALHLGRSALATSQAALEVTGNNLANAATEGYTRQKAVAAPGPSRQIEPGVFVGTGVRLEAIARQVDEALNQRVRTAGSDHQAALARQNVLGQIESIQDELGDGALTKRIEAFFEAWSQLASNPTDEALKGLVISEGESLAKYMGKLRHDMVGVRDQVDEQLRSGVGRVNELLDQVAELNEQIGRMEGGRGGAHALHDRRDAALKELAEHLDISIARSSSGMVDVFVGSTPLLLGTDSRGVKVEYRADEAGQTATPQLRVASEGDLLRTAGGKLGQLVETRGEDVGEAIAMLDRLAHQLAEQVNRVHSSGQATRAFDALTSAAAVTDPAAPLDEAGLPFEVRNGSFMVHVTQQSTGQRTGERIEIDLGHGGDTTLEDVAAALDAVDMLNASLTSDGHLRIEAASSDHRFTFSDDGSGALAALGVNTFFTGSDASNLDVHATLKGAPAYLAVAQDHVQGDNRTAQAAAGLLDRGIDALDGQSLRGFWSRHVEDYAGRTAQAKQQVQATGMIAESLAAQWQSHSGVNVDEEAIDMLAWQRTFQGAARFIGVVDEMMQTLITMTR